MAGVAAVNSADVQRYPIPVMVARERLAAAPLPEALQGFGGHTVSVMREDGGLVWRLGDDTHRSRGKVTLQGDGAATNVTVRFDLADNAIDASPLSKTRLTKSLATSIFAEHVDSVLRGRDFDQGRMTRFTAYDIQAHPGMLQEFGEAVRQQMISVADMINGKGEFAAPVPVTIDGRRQQEAATHVNRNSFEPLTDLSSKE
jgi:hypothetical protein